MEEESIMAISKEQVECIHEFGASVKGWCTCIKCGLKKRISKIKEEKGMELHGTDKLGNEFTIHSSEGAETPELVMPKKAEKPEPVEVTLSSGKVTTGPVVTIICSECGAERIIKKQDEFQVTRCIACQKKAMNKKRYESRKINQARKKAEAAAGEEVKAE